MKIPSGLPRAAGASAFQQRAASLLAAVVLATSPMATPPALAKPPSQAELARLPAGLVVCAHVRLDVIAQPSHIFEQSMPRSVKC